MPIFKSIICYNVLCYYVKNEPLITELGTITNDFVLEVKSKLNNRLKQRHNFETPIQVFNKLFINKKVAFIT